MKPSTGAKRDRLPNGTARLFTEAVDARQQADRGNHFLLEGGVQRAQAGHDGGMHLADLSHNRMLERRNGLLGRVGDAAENARQLVQHDEALVLQRREPSLHRRQIDRGHRVDQFVEISCASFGLQVRTNNIEIITNGVTGSSTASKNRICFSRKSVSNKEGLLDSTIVRVPAVSPREFLLTGEQGRSRTRPPKTGAST